MINTVPAPAALTAPWGSSSHLQTHLNTHTIPHLVKHGLPPSTRPSCFIRHLQIVEHKPCTSHALLLECTNTNPQLCLPWCYMHVLNAKCVLMAQGLSSKDYDSLLCAAEDELHKLLREEKQLQPSFAGGWLCCWSRFIWPLPKAELPAEDKGSLQSGAAVARLSCRENCCVNAYLTHTRSSMCCPETCAHRAYPCASICKSIRSEVPYAAHRKPRANSNVHHTPECQHYSWHQKPLHGEEPAASGTVHRAGVSRALRDDQWIDFKLKCH